MTDPKTPMLVEGMHGMGDCIHQRAVIRALLKKHTIWLETSWPCIYHDLVGPDLRLLRRPVALRTQLKNAARERDKFDTGGPSPHHRMPKIHMTYGRNTIRPGTGTILEAMFLKAGIPDAYKDADYRLPIPPDWYTKLDMLLTLNGYNASGKPLMVYRPLVERPEWRGSMVRNANPDDYAAIFAAIRDSFFVVSVADLEPAREWIVGPILKADLTLHKGELPFEALAALFSRAACVYTSSGFGAVLAPAVGTPCISIQGGFEPSVWHSDGAKFAPYLGIDPIQPCMCSTSACTNPCTKKVDVPRAIDKVRIFAKVDCGIPWDHKFADRPINEVFDPAQAVTQVRQPPHTLRQATRVGPRIGHPSMLARIRPAGGVKA